jgi:hypothetical protein
MLQISRYAALAEALRTQGRFNTTILKTLFELYVFARILLYVLGRVTPFWP